jgi:quinolinate synthase
MVLWQGSCIVHETFSEKKILQLKMEHANAEIIAHPECEEAVLRHAQFIGSTTALLKYVQTRELQGNTPNIQCVQNC